MKKLFLTITLVAAGMLAANAQDGLPVKGDYSIGVNANPFLNFVGGMLSDAGSTAPGFSTSTTNPLGIRARYFTADNKAVRTDFIFGTTATKTNSVNSSDSTKIDESKTNSFTSGTLVGLEMKRFKGRVIASYGPQVGVNYTTGGRIEDFNANTSTITETKGGNTFGITAGGFIGIEYFFTKNISLGGEFGLNLNYTNTSERTRTVSGTTKPVSLEENNFGIVNATNSGLSLSIYF